MSTLTDGEIRVEIDANRLIRNADITGLAGACYELRMGNVYYDLTEDGKRFELGPDEKVLIKPGHRVALITAEDVDIPNDILVRIVSKGSLFSIGLSPVATYADPGFSGNLGIVTENVSDKYIELPQGEAIAKADFTRLSGIVVKSYDGQHGFRTGIWPIKTHLQKTHAEVKGDKRVRNERDEALALLPAATRTIIRRVEGTQFWIAFGLGLAILLNAGALFAIRNEWMTNIDAITTNLLTSAVIGVGTLLMTYFRKT
ncbi:dCTP deaminase domain-containing protein [Aminobacter ciceronei]|jgi:dCTP deaminase|uniref:dCTP deaminase domain-containing protein n=1 Tax=Aminobacter ciceronei TaxID=150723 RepID=UPI003F72A5D6